MHTVIGVLVTYNPEYIFFQLQVRELSKQLDHLIIIDNNSLLQHKLQDYLLIGFSSITFVALEENIGLASAQNIGVKKAFDLSAKNVIFFDQDSLIEPEFVTGLLSAEAALLAAGEKVGAIGPVFFDPRNKLNYPATVYVGPFLKRILLDKPNCEVKATFVIASGCLIRTVVLNEVGLMRDQLFIDYIDVEWSLRAKHSGFNVYITSRAKMAHAIGDDRVNILGRTISIHSPLRRYYLIRNSFFMLRQSYIPSGYKLREVCFNLLRLLTGFVFSKERKKYIYYAYWGVRDGVSGIFGSCKHHL